MTARLDIIRTFGTYVLSGMIGVVGWSFTTIWDGNADDVQSAKEITQSLAVEMASVKTEMSGVKESMRDIKDSVRRIENVFFQRQIRGE